MYFTGPMTSLAQDFRLRFRGTMSCSDKTLAQRILEIFEDKARAGLTKDLKRISHELREKLNPGDKALTTAKVSEIVEGIATRLDESLHDKITPAAKAEAAAEALTDLASDLDEIAYCQLDKGRLEEVLGDLDEQVLDASWGDLCTEVEQATEKSTAETPDIVDRYRDLLLELVDSLVVGLGGTAAQASEIRRIFEIQLSEG